MKIFVASYTYIHQNNFAVFRHFKNKQDLFFILPKIWRSKKGKRIPTNYRPAEGYETIPTRTPFYHSNYPLIRGQLKGWMPFLGSILKKHAKPGDILYSSYEPNLLVTYLYSRLAKKLGMKHVFFTWQNVPYRQRMSGLKLKLIEWLLRKNIEMSAGGLCGMERAFEIHKTYFELNPNLKVGIIPQTGIDVKEYRPGLENDFRQKYGLEDKFVFLYAATFTERKGTLPTLEAFARISKSIPDARLVMVGTGELESQIRKNIENFGLAAKVTVLPWQPVKDLAPLYAQCDVLVHPSKPFRGWEEQFGLLILQAQACGTPVIATKSGSLEESILDKKTGVLVEPDDTVGLASAMEKLASDRHLCRKMGDAAREYIIEHFSEESVARRLEQYFYGL